jgi:hypothetical protein
LSIGKGLQPTGHGLEPEGVLVPRYPDGLKPRAAR